MSLECPLDAPVGDDSNPTLTSALATIITILCRPIQRLENAFQQMLTQRSVDAAVGAQLDLLGKIVGQGRAGLTDDVYRRYIRARIATNRSSGKREEVINIARLVVGDVSSSVFVRQEQVATCFVRIDDVAVDGPTMTALVAFLEAAVGAAIRVVVQSAPAAPAAMFKFSGGTPGPGFDNTASPGSGGKLADVRD